MAFSNDALKALKGLLKRGAWGKAAGVVDETHIANVSSLEEKLNKPIGEILESYGAVSPELKETVGRIQALTIATVKAYDAGDDEFKKAIEESGFVKDAFRGDGKEFNASALFGISRNSGDFDTIEEKAIAIEETLKARVTSLGVTEELIAEGIAINATRGGVNQDPAVSLATPITPIYSALDSDLAAASKAITAIHLGIRSGLGRIQIGKPDVAAATKAKASNFNGKIFENDPAHIKRMLRSGARLNAFELGEENALPPLPEDIINLQDGIQKAHQDLFKISEKLEGKVDIGGLVDDTGRYWLATRDWVGQTPAAEKRKSASSTAGIHAGGDTEAPDEAKAADAEPASEPLADPLALAEEKLAELQKKKAKKEKPAPEDGAESARKASASAFKPDTAGDTETDDLDEEIEKATRERDFLQALINAIGKDNISNNLTLSMNDGSVAWLANNLRIIEAKDGEATFMARGDGYSFKVTPTAVEHIDTDNDLSAQEALQFAKIASLNQDMINRGVTITGSADEKAMLKLAIDEINKTASPKIRILNEDDITLTPTSQARMEAFLDERKNEDGSINYSELPAHPMPRSKKAERPSPQPRAEKT